MPQNPTPLALWVQDNTCTCGNRWVHSYLTHANGGTLTATEEHGGTIVAMHSSRRLHTYCYRCHRLHLNLDWIRPKATPVAPKVPTAVPLSTLFAKLKQHLEP